MSWKRDIIGYVTRGCSCLSESATRIGPEVVLLGSRPDLIPNKEKPRMSGAEDGNAFLQNDPDSRKRTFFRLFRLAALRETYLVVGEGG